MSSSTFPHGTVDRPPAAAVGIPAPAPHVLERPRLTEALSVDVPLALVVAPAGAGKTVAVSTWAATVRGPLAWVSFDRTDLDGPAPWGMIVDALRGAGVRVPSLMSLGDREQDRRALPTMVGAHVAAHPGGVVLVLDCDGPVPVDLAEGLERVLRHSLGRLRLVVLARTDPPLPLQRHRLDGSVTELRAGDLSFRPEEVTALLASSRLVRSRDTSRSLHLRTWGWAAGLRFAVLDATRRGGAEASVRDLTGSAGPVAEYLRTEVLDALDVPDRRLLLDCSVVELLPPGLVDALGGPRAGRRLERLRWAFVEEVPEHPGSLRVHPLVRELLYDQLIVDEPVRAQDLHQRVGRWLAGLGRFDEATRQAASAGAWQDAAGYAIEAGVAESLLGPSRTDLLPVLDPMPAGTPGAGAAIVRAVAAATREDLGEAAAQAAEARAAATAVSPAAAVALDLLDLAVASGSGDAEDALAAADRTTQAVVAGPGLAAAIGARRGDALLVLGRLEEAAQAYRGIDARLGRHALVEAVSGQLRTARTLAERALALPGAADPCAQLALAWVDAEGDAFDLARTQLRRAGAVAVTTADPVPGVLLAVLDARLRRAAGDLEGARAALAVPPEEPAWLADLLMLELAALDLAEGLPSTALERHAALADRTSVGGQRLLWQVRLAQWADGSHPEPDPGATLAARVEGWLLEASRRLSLGEPAAARRAVQRALSIAAPEQLRRPFREASADVRRLLLEEGAVRAPARSPQGRPVRPDPMSAEPVRDLVEPLTEKEREVLGHLAAMLSTDEIAAAMFVSVNTVRTHVRNILRKLGAARRNEAVRRARALQLIPA